MTKKIMVIDDDSDTLALVRTFLEEDYTVLPMKSAAAALTALPAEKPDLILTDVLMPSMTGYQFWEAFKKIEQKGPEIPVIVMSGRQSMKDFFEPWSIAGFLKKPFTKESLREAVSQAVKDKREAPPAVKEEKPPRAGRVALIAGVDNYIMRAIKDFLEAQNCRVEIGLDENHVVKSAAEVSPDFIFCQFWEDDTVFDAAAVGRGLGLRDETKKIPFAVFCIPALSFDARKNFSAGQVFPYSDKAELLSKLETHLKNLK